MSFFIGCFRGSKSGLRISSFLAFSFLVLSLAYVLGLTLACAFVGLARAKTTLLKTIIAFRQAIVAFLSFGPPSKVLDLVLVQRQRMLFRSFWIFLYLFLCLFLFFSSPGGPGMVWTARHTHCCLIINVAMLASRLIFGPLRSLPR